MVLEVPSQFSMGQTVKSLTCSIKEKPHTELDNCLRILLSCFREKMSGDGQEQQGGQTGFTPEMEVFYDLFER